MIPLPRAPDESRYRHVLVALDGSDFARAAMSTARALALRFDAALHTICVVDGADTADDLRVHALDALWPDANDDHVHIVVDGEPAEAIAQEAERLGSCLVCLSSHGRGRLSGAVIGSVTRALLQRSRDPVVVVGPQADRPPLFGKRRRPPRDWLTPLSVRRIVACVDGSAASEAVLPVALAWANALTMSLAIVTVAQDVLPPLRLDGETTRRFGPNGDADAYVERLVARSRATAADVTGRVVFDSISPADGVRAYLYEEPAGLIAVTTHARTGLQRVRLGAEAANIVRASVAPALVVPLPPELVHGHYS